MGKLWYAVMRDLEDNDWGTGFHTLEEAVREVKEQRALGRKDAYIAVIDDGDDPVCIEEIHDFPEVEE
jgi:hypothetical protein